MLSQDVPGIICQRHGKGIGSGSMAGPGIVLRGGKFYTKILPWGLEIH